MVTLLKNLLMSRETRRIELAEKLEEEQRNLDDELDDETNNINSQPTSCMQNVIQTSALGENEPRDNNANQKSGCFKRTGWLVL